ncbi:MAG: HAD-IIIA family hydrolase [Fimbriimonadaceae bacterium]|nr:HAD-IIIA family hydrolase [Fimbriimonadaceae bacterium]
MARRAVFLDRDGVLVENPPNYVQSESDIEYFESAFEACRLLTQAGFPQIIITNQSLVGRGMMDFKEIERLNNVIVDRFNQAGANIIHAYICPHAPDDGCDCRKPSPGNLYQAAKQYDLDLPQSFMIGDAVTDLKAGIAAGATPILVRTGRGLPQEELLHQEPELQALVVDDLLQAVKHILSHSHTPTGGRD